MKTFYRAECLFTGENFIDDALFSVEQGVFRLEDAVSTEAIELEGLVAPGFIDVQVNGGGGAFFNADQTPDCLDKIAKAHGQFGSTALMPTLITDKVEIMQAAADATAKAISEGVPGVLGNSF